MSCPLQVVHNSHNYNNITPPVLHVKLTLKMSLMCLSVMTFSLVSLDLARAALERRSIAKTRLRYICMARDRTLVQDRIRLE